MTNEIGNYTRIALLILLLGLISFQFAKAEGKATLKVGVVKLNTALNTSLAGKRSKNILVASKNQKESELKGKEENLKKLSEEIKNNIMLSETARLAKEKEIKKLALELRSEVQKAQKDLQNKERKLTESIFTELKTIIRMVAKEEKFDFVLEDGASQTILYSKFEFIDITDKVIKRYDGLNK